MCARRFDKIVSEVEEQKKISDAAMKKMADARKQREDFRISWLSVYPSGMTAEALEQTIRRLWDLVPLIENRFWDFLISEMLELSNLENDTHAALLILGHACARDAESVRHCLNQIERVPLAVPVQHGELLDTLWYRLSQVNLTVPNTPPLSQEDLAQVLGLTYGQVRWAVRTGKWLNPPDDRVKHKRPRRWQHKFDEQQREVLKIIREKHPEMLWACLEEQE